MVHQKRYFYFWTLFLGQILSWFKAVHLTSAYLLICKTFLFEDSECFRSKLELNINGSHSI